MSGSLDLNMLLKAYAIGVFPMADDRDADDIYWVEPVELNLFLLR